MKRIYFLFAFLALAGFLKAQTFVTTDAQLRNAVLEEFTGIHCQYCPDGHKIAQQLHDSAAIPGRVVLINIHEGPFATPTGTQPDFQTDFGTELASQAGVTGYPSATINRHIFPGSSATEQGRGAWRDDVNQILPLPSPVNVGFQSSFDSVTRLLTVVVELYYTNNSPQSVNFINVALTQNNIVGFQQVGTVANANYVHKHALRHLITGQWGDSVLTTTQGSFVTRTYTYTVSPSYKNIPCNVNNCDISVFVSESHQEIYTGVSGPAINGSSNGVTSLYIGSLTSDLYITEGVAAVQSTFNTVVTSFQTNTGDFVVTLTGDAPSDWSSSFNIAGVDYSTTDTINLALAAIANIAVHVTPGTTPAFANYTLTLTSLSHPTATPQEIHFSIISGITNLIVTGSGSWGDGGNHNYDQVYPAALAATGCTSYATTTAQNMAKGVQAKVMGNVKNIFFDVGWRFPSFTDDEALALDTFLTAGGNLFVAGQDIGWDMLSGDGYGSAITQDFFTNFLHASYINDGGTANNKFTGNPNDTIFHWVGTTSIINYYGGSNFFPDQLDTTQNSVPCMFYNSLAAKIAGIRYNNSTYKIVYLGAGMEMVGDTTIRNRIIDYSYRWFNGTFVTAENKEMNANISVFPNPANDHVTIACESVKAENFNISVVDILGNTLKEAKIYNKADFHYSLDTRDLASGMYFVRINNQHSSKTFKVNISK